MLASSKDTHSKTPQTGALPENSDEPPSAIIAIEYKEHQVLLAQKKEVITSLPDGNNEEIIVNINHEFAEKQQAEAMVLLKKTMLIRDGVRVTGIPFHGTFKVYVVEVSYESSALVILTGMPLDQRNKPQREDLIDIAITEETYILYTQS